MLSYRCHRKSELVNVNITKNCWYIDLNRSSKEIKVSKLLPVRESILVLQVLFEHQKQQDALNSISKVQETCGIVWEQPHHFVHILQIQVINIRLGLWAGCDRFSDLFRPPYHIFIVIVLVAVYIPLTSGRITVHLCLFILSVRRVLPLFLHFLLLAPRLL